MEYHKLYSNANILRLSIYSAKYFKSIPIILTQTTTKYFSRHTVSLVDYKSLRHLKNKTILAKVLVGLQLFQCVHISCKTSTSNNLYECVISLLLLCILSNATYHLHELQQNSNELVTYLKGIFYLEHSSSVNFTRRVSSLNEKLSRIFALMVLSSGFVFAPAFLLGFHFSNPCQASLIGYQFLTECRINNSHIDLHQYLYQGVEKISLFILNIWVLNFSMNATVFVAAVGMVICPTIFRDQMRR